MCVILFVVFFFFFFFKQKTAYEMRISDWSSDVCSSDLLSPASISMNFSRCVPWINDPPMSAKKNTRTRGSPQRAANVAYAAGSVGHSPNAGDRKRVVEGKSGEVSVDIGGRRKIKKTDNV